MTIHSGRSRFRTAVLITAGTVTLLTAVVLTCGPFLTDLVTVMPIEPSHRAEFAQGSLGVVRPRFARRYLVQAYRRFTGKPALAATLEAGLSVQTNRRDLAEWFTLRDTVLKGQPDVAKPDGGRFDPSRRIANYQWMLNCHDAAFAQAASTLTSRMQQWGATSPAVLEWTRAQVIVFENCSGAQLVLPAPAAAGADPTVRADRAYQTAAAYFYGASYEEAGRRFREIASDASSPWRMYGRYLAARAAIRQATVPDDGTEKAARLFAEAEADLGAVLGDSSASSLHESARGLLGFIAFRVRPINRLHELSRTLATSDEVPGQALIDYQRAMDKFVGDTVDYEYGSVRDVEALRRDDDLTDWVLAMQGTGEASVSRALTQWKATPTTPWLVAVLWKVPASHPDAATVMTAASRLDPSSPAFDTVTFLRVRLLAAQGKRDEARSILAALPSSSVRPAETANLLDAERFMLARTFDELLASAPRTIVVEAGESGMYGALRRARSAKDARGSPTFDEDAATVFTARLPLDRLVTAAGASALPERLRTRVAVAAFTRAWLLGREDAALAVVPHLRRLAPHLSSDLDRYAAASTGEDRRRAGLLLVLRTPGMHLSVRGIDDEVSYQAAEPLRTFDHTFSRNWWCGISRSEQDGMFGGPVTSAAMELLYGKAPVPLPEFLTAAERDILEREMQALASRGPAPQFLASEALALAGSKTIDSDAAEALAQVIEGWRWTCPGSERDARLPRRAFETLHRLFPRSTWALKTKYWYP